MGPFVFACQMLQNPLAGKAQGFDPEWFRSLPDTANRAGMNIYIVVAPASEKKRGSDYTVMWVVGLNHDNNYYVLEGVRDRLNLAEQTQALFGLQADIQHIEYIMGSETTALP